MMPPVDLTRTTRSGVCLQTKPADLWRVVWRDEINKALRRVQNGAFDTALLWGWRVDESDLLTLLGHMDRAPEWRERYPVRARASYRGRAS